MANLSLQLIKIDLQLIKIEKEEAINKSMVAVDRALAGLLFKKLGEIPTQYMLGL